MILAFCTRETALQVAVVDEKYFNHSFVSPCFAPEYPVLQGILGFM